MATAISWTDETWNPIIGCSIVSPGCTNCYAMRDAYRKGYNPRLPSYHGLTEKRKNNPIWNGVVRRNSDTSFYKVLKWKNRPGLKVFVNSMGDLFHEEAEPRDVLEVIEIIRSLPDLRFQVLTKREEYALRFIRDHGITLPPNLWMGMSVENADWKKRIDALRTIPAEIRFVSAEPLVGPLGALDLDGIHWVITGGESGPRSKIRFTNPAWIRDIQKQCSEQGTAFFHKQHGVHPANFTTGDAGFVFDGSSGGGFLMDGRPYQDFPSIPSPAPVHRASSPKLASASVVPVQPPAAPAPAQPDALQGLLAAADAIIAAGQQLRAAILALGGQPPPKMMPPMPIIRPPSLPKVSQTEVDQEHIMPVLLDLMADSAVWESGALRALAAQKLGLVMDARFKEKCRWALVALCKRGEIVKVSDQRYQKV